MTDPMQEMVCPKCGSEALWVDDNAPDACWCEDCRDVVVPETRAEYLAALEDQSPGVDR